VKHPIWTIDRLFCYKPVRPPFLFPGRLTMRRGHWLTLLGLGSVALAIVATGAAPDAGSKVTVKVYSVADLVAPIRVAADEPERMTLSNWSAIQQTGSAERIDRIISILRLALPHEQWEDAGPGAIAGFPEKLSLVVRQTEAGHLAIEELLRQIRAEDDVEIELAIEFGQRKPDAQLTLWQLLNHPLTAEQVPAFRNCLAGETTTATLRVGNGSTVAPGSIMSGPAIRFTAVLDADQAGITLRMDNIADDMKEDGTMPWASQSVRIPVGTSVGLEYYCDGGTTICLVTPRIVPRKQP
jgi:hypothetical protein